MKIYTKTGDTGQSSLYGGSRVSKFSRRIEAYGSVDELNSYIGLILSYMELDHEGRDKLLRIQSELMTLGADLATLVDEDCSPESDKKRPKSRGVLRLDNSRVIKLEKEIDTYSEKLPVLRSFILPGGSQLASQSHVARSICRRAERMVVRLADVEKINPIAIKYLNRLSDWLFVFARYQNSLDGGVEQAWNQHHAAP